MGQDILREICDSIVTCEMKDIARLVQTALNSGIPVEDILRKGIFVGLEIVGKNFQDNTFFVSDMLHASKVAQKGISLLKPYLDSCDRKNHHRVIIGTVEGDLHDIGKGLVAATLKLNGFDVIDLGVDVSEEDFLEALRKYPDTEIVALSALLTMTMANMRKTVATLRANYPDAPFQIMVGGAPVTQEFADAIGADAYSEDAVEAVAVARRLCHLDSDSI